MKTTRLILTLPHDLKRKLDAKRQEGYTAAGYVRALLERELSPAPAHPSKTKGPRR